ncbi:MAG: GNAT family N-acetyltransferase [Rhodobacteraceae bacterium]|nr:GNAT family N-acetyltransferase [Paracoccaceae bacterium]
MPGEVVFAPVADAAGLARLDAALRALSADIAEDYATDRAALERAVLGPVPAAHGCLALNGADTVGAALYSPNFSTVRGAAGIYVSDLWVARAARGQGLGARLLAQVARAGGACWGATWLRLAAYHHSRDALAFYARLGFTPADAQQELRLDPEATETLIRRAG